MTGFTDAVVLEAPIFWWPSLGDISRHPLHPTRSLFAGIADAAMPWPLPTASPDVVRTVGLSRLGRSVFATATWTSMEEGDKTCFATVWNPVSAAAIHLPVCTTIGVGSSTTTWQELSQLDLARLANYGRVRLTHRTVQNSSRGGGRGVATSAKRRLEELQREVRQHPAYPLLHRVLEQVYTLAVKHLRRVAPHVTAASTTAPTWVTSSFAHSILFTGDLPSQRHLQHLLERSTPSLFPLRTDTEAVAALVALEKRRLNFAEVLTLSEHEALETVEVALRAPPLALATSTASSPRSVVPGLLVVLEGLQLLEASANAMVGGVIHQLCMCLEALRGGPVPVLVWSFAQDSAAMPVALLSRVGAQQVRVATTAPEDRAAYLRTRLTAATAAVARGSPCTAALSAATEVVVEETAHWSVDRLVRLPDAALSALYAAHIQSTAAPAKAAAAAAFPPALAASASAEPLHAVYGHLYGVDEDIRKVEELVVWPLTHLPLLQALAIPCTKGVLLCGPSGSGKTALLASLVRRLQLPADTRGLNVMSVDGLALIEKEVGRSEKNIAQLFENARSLAPTALFIDNLDSLAPPRGRTTAETNTTGDRTLSTLLTQMDGVSGQAGRVVVVVASAPSLETLDAAVYRPGRLDVHVHLRPPPMVASAAFVKRRLRDFTLQLCTRLGVTGSGEPTPTAPPSFSDALVDDFFAAALHQERGRNTSATSMSPAEVSAVVREIVFYVAERVGGKATKGEGQALSREDVERCMTEAFARLGAVEHGT